MGEVIILPFHGFELNLFLLFEKKKNKRVISIVNFPFSVIVTTLSEKMKNVNVITLSFFSRKLTLQMSFSRNFGNKVMKAIQLLFPSTVLMTPQ